MRMSACLLMPLSSGGRTRRRQVLLIQPRCLGKPKEALPSFLARPVHSCLLLSALSTASQWSQGRLGAQSKTTRSLLSFTLLFVARPILPVAHAVECEEALGGVVSSKAGGQDGKQGGTGKTFGPQDSGRRPEMTRRCRSQWRKVKASSKLVGALRNKHGDAARGQDTERFGAQATLTACVLSDAARRCSLFANIRSSILPLAPDYPTCMRNEEPPEWLVGIFFLATPLLSGL